MRNKTLRIRKLKNQISGKSVIIPLDHGVTSGYINGLGNIRELIGVLSKANPEALILHKGIIKSVADIIPSNISVIMHLSASLGFSSKVCNKVLVSNVEEAIQYGADGVSIHLNFGSEYDEKMLSDFGKVSNACDKWGMPLIAMVYPNFDISSDAGINIDVIKHLIRVCEELGADYVKLPFWGTGDVYKEILSSINIPVLLAGGPKSIDEDEFISVVKNVMGYGGSGVSIGRNIFQNSDPYKYLSKICEVVHNRK